MVNGSVGRLLLCSAAVFAAWTTLGAQHNFTPADIEAGGRLYQSSCAGCHGAAGDQVPGTALRSGRFRHGTTDDDIARIIRSGIPGTSMPPNPMSETEAATIVAWFRATGGATLSGPPGDAARGKLLFTGKGNCTSCHGAGGTGGRRAPSLVDVGVIRQHADLSRSLLDPSADIHGDFRTIKVTAKTGATTTGRLLNQNSYSIQLLDTGDRLRSFDKGDLTDATILPTSPMPSYAQIFSPQDTADVVAFLVTMRGMR